MKVLHGVLHGGLWIRFHGLFSKINSRTYCKEDFIIDSKINSRTNNTPPSNSLKLTEFETYYIELNSPLFFRQQNMQWSYNMVHSHFTLCLRARDYIKRPFPTPMVQPLDKGQGSLTITRSRLLAHV